MSTKTYHLASYFVTSILTFAESAIHGAAVYCLLLSILPYHWTIFIAIPVAIIMFLISLLVEFSVFKGSIKTLFKIFNHFLENYPNILNSGKKNTFIFYIGMILACLGGLGFGLFTWHESIALFSALRFYHYIMPLMIILAILASISYAILIHGRLIAWIKNSNKSNVNNVTMVSTTSIGQLPKEAPLSWQKKACIIFIVIVGLLNIAFNFWTFFVGNHAVCVHWFGAHHWVLGITIVTALSAMFSDFILIVTNATDAVKQYNRCHSAIKKTSAWQAGKKIGCIMLLVMHLLGTGALVAQGAFTSSPIPGAHMTIILGSIALLIGCLAELLMDAEVVKDPVKILGHSH
jgi:hypothetical protein